MLGRNAVPLEMHGKTMIAGIDSALGEMTLTPPSPGDALRRRFERVRALSAALVAGLSDADVSGQSMPDASPSKWHLAHTTWFFETFVLRDFVRGYRPFNSAFAFLYNSYYEVRRGPRREAIPRDAHPPVA